MQTLRHKKALRAANRAATRRPAPYKAGRSHARKAGRLARLSTEMLRTCKRSLARIGVAIREKTGV